MHLALFTRLTRILALAPVAFLVASCSQHSSAGIDFVLPVGVEPLEDRLAAAPKVGERFPDVTIVDDEGEAVNIRSLASEKPYTVLTLGCLT